MHHYQDIEVEKRGSIAIVHFNRPAQMNTYTAMLEAELRDSFMQLDRDDEVRCIIVTGKGKAFCAGADVEELGDSDLPATGELIAREKGLKNCDPIHVRKPIIAAINGHAVGVGITMTLQFDIRIVAEDAKLGFVFPRRGIISELGSHWILPRMIGASKAAELLLTGRLFLGTEAVEMGLASQAVPKDQVLDTAIALAEDIAENCAPVSVALTKRLLWSFLGEPDYVKALDIENKYFDWTRTKSDAEEGVLSFFEKRKPSWKGRLSEDFPADMPSLVKNLKSW